MNEITANHCQSLIRQAEALGWSSEAAQRGTGPSLIAFWQNIHTRLVRSNEILNRCARLLGHSPIESPVDLDSFASETERRCNELFG
jgi:hypothetical protein